MSSKKILLLVIFSAIIIFGISYLWQALPVISAYGAKNLCSCVFVAEREPNDVINGELNYSLIKYGTFEIDRSNNSATGSVFGLAKRTAFYRDNMGCTLLNEITKEKLQQPYQNIKPIEPLSDSIEWPLGEKVTDSFTSEVNKEDLNRVVEAAFSDNRYVNPSGTRGLVVVYDGKLISENYKPTFTSSTRQLGWSMTKSVTNALVGLMVMKEELRVDQPAPINEWQNDPRKKITIDDLLRMSSGLEWEEKYGGVSTATEMLFKSHNTGYYALQQPLKNDPGETWYYSSGTTNILSYIIKSRMSLKEYLEMPYVELFNKLGMSSAVIEPDASGTYIGSSFMYATPRDWARFGLLFMNDGVWLGERLLPEGWVEYTTRSTPDADGKYGAHFWLNKNHVRLPDVPDDTFIMSGFQGQRVFIIPSEKLIVVRLGFDPDEHFDFNALISDIIMAIKKN